MSTPLDGVRVLDLTTGIDGPFCTRLLTGLGAETIKIEPPEGDPTRRLGPFPDGRPDIEMSALFAYLNGGKRSITLDLENDANIFMELASRVDILVENFPPGTMAEWRLDPDLLLESRPSLVIGSVTPFGQTGRYSSWRGPDIVRQAVCGWMAQGGDPAREPLRSGGDISLYITGICAAAAILGAYHYAQETGEGQHVDVSAMEAMVTMTGQEVYRTAMDGAEVAFGRLGDPGITRTMLPCRDGTVGINLMFERDWSGFLDWVGLSQIADQPRYSSLMAVREHGVEEYVMRHIAAWVAERSQEYLVNEGQRRRLAIAPVLTVDQMADCPQHVARSFFDAVAVDGLPPFHRPGPPFRMSESEWADLDQPPAMDDGERTVLAEIVRRWADGDVASQNRDIHD
jgi:crotonobetainyl-CoA:carnitine CoA-transferase CaiB-like acyl-CoA transferase